MTEELEPNGKTRTKVAVLEARLDALYTKVEDGNRSNEQAHRETNEKLDRLLQSLPVYEEKFKQNDKEHGEHDKLHEKIDKDWGKWKGLATSVFLGTVAAFTGAFIALLAGKIG